MKTIERSSAFKKDYKRVKKMPRYSKSLDTLLLTIIDTLFNDKSLPQNYHDHALNGNWENYRECHLKPDPLLIYQRPNKNILRLARLGSHSELFE